MDTATTTTNPSRKSPEPESETPTRIHHAKPGSLTNGVLKRHHHSNHHAPPVVVVYRECLKNHAATIGGHALDGCGEFMPSPGSTPADPTSLKCAACGCHRNFHRRDPDDSPLPPPPPPTHVIEYHPHHRHHPPPPPPRSPNSASPPPISSSYMLLALSSAPESQPHPPPLAAAGLSRKRFRTKFSQSQKEKMFEFAGRVGWKVQKRDEDLIQEFCHEIGVDRNVLKVWMHNNKNTLGKNKDGPTVNGGNPGDDDDRSQHIRGDDATQMGTNGSSSSS